MMERTTKHLKQPKSIENLSNKQIALMKRKNHGGNFGEIFKKRVVKAVYFCYYFNRTKEKERNK